METCKYCGDYSKKNLISGVCDSCFTEIALAPTITVEEFEENFDEILDDVIENGMVYRIRIEEGKWAILKPYLEEENGCD